MERDAYVMISEKGEKLYHMMMSKKVNLIDPGSQGRRVREALANSAKCFA